MPKTYQYVKYVVALILLVGIFFTVVKKDDAIHEKTPINGVNLVASRSSFEQESLLPMLDINANWVAIVPYAFSFPEKPEVHFNTQNQWWGERKEGIIATTRYAKNLGLQVMFKPHVWVRGQGWAGDFTLHKEKDWQVWEKQYAAYVMALVTIADSMEVEMICIGTEYRKAVVERPKFWENLISKIRNSYNGKLTYAANWDNFQNVFFWDQLDYIGIDAYFPLSAEKSPEVEELLTAWKLPFQDIKKFHEHWDKPVIFTEYGYQSHDHTADGHWKYDFDTLELNMKAQKNAYEALYSTFWNEPWFSGGFIWKWHSDDSRAGGPEHKQYSPQNKPVLEVIKTWYGKPHTYRKKNPLPDSSGF